jgi:hypothetical protein
MSAAGLERIGKRLMLYRNQMVGRELIDDPFDTEATDAAVVFSAEGIAAHAPAWEEQLLRERGGEQAVLA